METGKEIGGGVLEGLSSEQKIRAIAAHICMTYYSYKDSKNAKLPWHSMEDPQNTIRKRIEELSDFIEKGKFWQKF